LLLKLNSTVEGMKSEGSGQSEQEQEDILFSMVWRELFLVVVT